MKSFKQWNVLLLLKLVFTTQNLRNSFSTSLLNSSLNGEGFLLIPAKPLKDKTAER